MQCELVVSLGVELGPSIESAYMVVNYNEPYPGTGKDKRMCVLLLSGRSNVIEE